jgi:hypothetical protein
MAGSTLRVWSLEVLVLKVAILFTKKGVIMQSRRQFISLVGGGVVLAACSTTNAGIYPEKSVEAWRPIAPDIEIRQWILAHALLAPNPHNRQPWIADLRRENEITLTCDGDRLLPETDPFGRQILIGCGAFLELAFIAAAERGYVLQIQLFPNGEPPLTELPKAAVVARLTLSKNSSIKRDPLFQNIRSRHTNKGAYDETKVISADDAKTLQHIAKSEGTKSAHLSGLLTDAASMKTMRAITKEAYEIELTIPRTYLESANLFRVGPSEIERFRDGIPITGMMPRLLNTIGMFNRLEVPQKGSTIYNQVMSRWTPFETGSGYLWMATVGNSRVQQIDCGRAYVRTHLQATALKIDMHPLSQAVQEFAEVKAQNLAMYSLLGLDPKSVMLQMVVRIGFGTTLAEGTPRRALDSAMVRSTVLR